MAIMTRLAVLALSAVLLFCLGSANASEQPNAKYGTDPYNGAVTWLRRAGYAVRVLHLTVPDHHAYCAVIDRLVACSLPYRNAGGNGLYEHQ